MFRTLSLILLLTLLTQCGRESAFQQDQKRILSLFNQGEYTSASQYIGQAINRPGLRASEKDWLTARQAMMDRTRLDFSKTEKQIRSQLFRYYPILPDSLMKVWETSGHLEMKRIDKAKKYFKYAVSNLFRLDAEAAKVRQSEAIAAPDPLDSIRMENTAAIISAGKPGQPVETRRITIDYTITIDADAVPDGQEVLCWMPFPRESSPRQTNVVLLASTPAELVRAKAGSPHSSLFARKFAVGGTPTVFSYRAAFDISGQWFGEEELLSAPPGKIPGEIRDYTREELPHVVFSPRVRHLADSLAANESNPYKIIRSFYYWIDQNIPWASALEYSTFECIPDYVLEQGHGDCGMKTFLLLSMARYKGIPARWQSGWMLHPGEENLHDWCEIWFSDTGWVPVDMSFGLQKSVRPDLKEFYLSGIDSYRMIVNDGFAGEFDPTKKHYRSEPFDFQRGEVEWSGGNLYFNQWDYNLNVVSIEKKNQ